MTPERLRQIEELFHAVQEAPPSDREHLLSKADLELRGEVESLLARKGKLSPLDGSARFGQPTQTAVVAGARLGPYEIETKLGEGGMGEVFRGMDTRLGRPVAIKITHAEFNARFDREARAISSLNHPNICTLYDIGPNYLVMELIEGRPLSARLKEGALPVDEALRYAMQILDALGEAHVRGIVHRDLKPGNIMITRSGVKVLDFGLATWEGDDTLTGSHMVMGTPAYMAPEQREGRAADARTDLYSFGCVLYEMLTGVRATAERQPAASRPLEAIVARCLSTDPARRWQTAGEIGKAIQAVPHGSSRVVTRRAWILPAAAAAVCLLLAGLWYFFFGRVPKLTDRDVIVLADFVNNTGDSIFDTTLRQGLAIQLEQSSFLKIMDDDQVRRLVRLMSLPPDARITNATAREICIRAGSTATIDGAIANLGKNFVITLQAVTCRDGATLVREQVQAEDKEHVLNAMGIAAAAIRRKLGESHQSIRKLNQPLEEATTPSLEALQSYSEGTGQLGHGHFLAAVPLFERAIQIDPNFADAYFRLGVAYETAGDMRRSGEYAKEAFRLVGRASPSEQREITAYYYRATGELDKEINAWQSAARNYPERWVYHNQLGLVFVDMGRFEEGFKEAAEGARLNPGTDAPFRRELDAYICLDQIAKAKQLAQTLREKGIEGPRIHQRFLEMAYVEDDQAAILREIQWFSGKPEEYLSFGLQAANLNVHGRRTASHKFYRLASESAMRRGLQEVSREFEEADARADALSGNCETARGLGRPAIALAFCGDASAAEKLATETSKLFPNGTIWNGVQLPTIRAAIELHLGEPEKSVDLLVPALPYERSYLEASYVRGLAYLSLRKGAEAVSEFQKIVNHKGANWGATWVHPNWGLYYSLSYLGAARSFTVAGDALKARKAYQDFLALWKDADANIPVYQQAKAEASRIQ
jgi:eukaryotic-like serine/threonine-protein kinase